MASFADEGFCRYPNDSGTGLHRSGYACTGPNRHIIPNRYRMILGTVDNNRTRADVNALSTMNPAGNVNTRSNRCEIAQYDVMANGTIKIYVNMPPDDDVGRQYISGTYYRTDADINPLRFFGARVNDRFEAKAVFSHLFN
jgi:hypothetical protein